MIKTQAGVNININMSSAGMRPFPLQGATSAALGGMRQRAV